jgi:hypothetical protein
MGVTRVIPTSQSPGIRALLQVPQSEPLLKEIPISRAFSKYSNGSPAREPSPLKVPVYEPSSRFPSRSPYWKRCPSPEPFLHNPRGPQQGSPPLSKSRYMNPPPRSPIGAPIDRDAHLQSLSYLTISFPNKGAPLQVPSQSSHRGRHSTPRAPFNHISKSPADEPAPGCPKDIPYWAPIRRDALPRTFLLYIILSFNFMMLSVVEFDVDENVLHGHTIYFQYWCTNLGRLVTYTLVQSHQYFQHGCCICTKTCIISHALNKMH